MSKLISTRVPKEVEKDINQLARDKHIGKTLVLREVILKGLTDLKVEYALDLYQKGKLTLWKASQIAGISLWGMIDTVKERQIAVKYNLEDAKEDIKQVFGK